MVLRSRQQHRLNRRRRHLVQPDDLQRVQPIRLSSSAQLCALLSPAITTNNVATLSLNNVHLLLGRLTITAGNDTLSLWADPASIANLSVPIFTNSSFNFLSSLSSLGIISYNTSKSNAGGYLDALIVSNRPTASIDVTGVSVAGDFNLNGVVDAADYVCVAKGLGTTYSQSDYDVWRANFGRTVVSGSGSAEFASHTRAGDIRASDIYGRWLVSRAPPDHLVNPSISLTDDTSQKSTVVTHVF